MDAPVVVTLEIRSTTHSDRGVLVTARAARELASTTTWELTCTAADGDEVGKIVALGTVVEPGSLLVEKRKGKRDTSLRCAPHVRGEVVDVRADDKQHTVTIRVTRAVTAGDRLRLDGGEHVEVVAEVVDDLGGGDLVWPNVSGPHLVERIACAEDTLHARSIGPYSLITQQPLNGKAQFGGQRVEAAQLDALEARGAISTAHELMTVKSDDVRGRMKTYELIVRGEPSCAVYRPRATEVLEQELGGLGFAVDFTQDAVAIDFLDTESIKARMPRIVTKPETINYKSFKPERDGLFCEQVFGAVDSPERTRTFGRIELALPALHPWLFHTAATLLDVEPARFEQILYGTQTFAGESPDQPDATGVVAIRAALAALDLVALAAQSSPRGELARLFLDSGRAPDAVLCLDAWPVLPPDVRPIVPLDGGRFATSDLNDLYRRVINRNNRVRRLLELKAPEIILINEARMLQRSIDALVENGLRDSAVSGPDNRRLASLGELLAGPKGRFATNLLGKRVDYSAVAATVPVPSLPPDRVRIPRAAASELFRPWIFGWLEANGHVTTIKEAKQLVEARDPRADTALDAVTANYPVLMFPLEVSEPVKLASVVVELWDVPAFGLAPATIAELGLARGAAATLHVPISPRAIGEVRDLRRDPSIEPAPAQAGGWILRASAAETVPALAQILVDAALHREVDPVLDGPTRRILGRPAR